MSNLYYCTYVNDDGDTRIQAVEADDIVDAVGRLKTAMQLIDVKVKDIIAVLFIQQYR